MTMSPLKGDYLRSATRCRQMRKRYSNCEWSHIHSPKI